VPAGPRLALPLFGLLMKQHCSGSIRWSVVISVENNHYARSNSVNHRRNADDSGHRGENGKGTRRDERGGEQAEATKECNQTSSTRSPRVVAGRPLHGMKIASSARGLCWGLYLSSRTLSMVVAWLLNQTPVRYAGV
jgi:hypothetical protein